MDELTAPVDGQPFGQQLVRDVAVEDKGARDAGRGSQRVLQAHLIVWPHVAAEPDQGGIRGGAARREMWLTVPRGVCDEGQFVGCPLIIQFAL